MSRRSVLQLGAAAGLGASMGAAAPPPGRRTSRPVAPFLELEEATIAELGELLRMNRLRVRGLVNRYLRRIETLDTGEGGVNSIIELNPDAFDLADTLDDELRNGIDRGPLHGIPIVLKDNIDTGDQMLTTAGSLALVGAPALQDATVAAKLRAAGAVILGKATLSEWANFRGFNSSSGWSARGGQCRNPYVLDRNPCGSSSGSGAAVAASLCGAALGTETDGSIVCPASANGVVGIKPTVGLTSRAGVVPIAATQDTVGPLGRTIGDAAAVLGALTGVDPRDPATQASEGRSFTDYTQFLDPGGLAGKRIGVLRQLTGFSAETDEVFEQALAAMSDAGAVLVDPVDIPSFNEFANDSSEIIVLIYEFKRDLNAYLATRTGVPVSTMLDVIEFNVANADRELQFFGQEWFELAEQEIFSEQEYLEALERGPRLAGPEGIDAALQQNGLDALVAPTNSPAWPIDLVNGDAFLGGSSSFAAVAGYPLITMPAGFSFGLPVGISFMGTAWSEPQLITMCSGFENANPVRRPPTFIDSLPLPISELDRPRTTIRERRSATLRLSDRLAAMRSLARVPFHSL
ncbi:MAG TPA: amidase [Thermoanaerobaculia bacterium]|nr:amidase [Thermoanaerobaculia bacterium]